MLLKIISLRGFRKLHSGVVVLAATYSFHWFGRALGRAMLNLPVSSGKKYGAVTFGVGKDWLTSVSLSVLVVFIRVIGCVLSFRFFNGSNHYFYAQNFDP
jgi:hypothetical protein